MPSPRPHKAPKKPTNLSIDSELLAQARQLNIDLSATLEHALEQEGQTAQQTKWLSENKTKLDACNELADKNGLFADKHKVF